MAKPGRKPNAIPSIDWKLQIPEPLAVKFDTLHVDALTGKIPYGLRSEIIVGLIRQYLRDQNIPVD